jgi:hypothetical protein
MSAFVPVGLAQLFLIIGGIEELVSSNAGCIGPGCCSSLLLPGSFSGRRASSCKKDKNEDQSIL